MSWSPEIPFASYFVYSVRGESDESKKSKRIGVAVKNDAYIPVTRGVERKLVNATAWCVDQLKRDIDQIDYLRDLLIEDAVLVPVPRSGMRKSGQLWPALRVCQELLRNGLGGVAVELVERAVAVPKSATAPAGERPDPEAHYKSFKLTNKSIGVRPRIVLVDDIVTRGATFAGAYRRIREAKPNIPIDCFALFRVLSNDEAETMAAPVKGKIEIFQSGHSSRRVP